ncbi:MAG TPA: Rid family hydrolase [Caulobacteraceae bacterium]|jgi:enamine deaminase RidA (YjgF/YER057c/UK114 family)|nr:Rid family hydrolase [Caulobacteraceae bacterium]
MIKSLLATVALASTLLATTSALAAPQIERFGTPAFPISGVVVVHGVGGADIAYASGVPGDAKAGDTEAQTVDALKKLIGGLEAHGFRAGDIVMMRVFLVGDPDADGKMDFRGMMRGYTQFFGTPEQPNKPARTTVQVAGLASPGSLVEIEAQAVKGRCAAVLCGGPMPHASAAPRHHD